jgi:hypothetical protein
MERVAARLRAQTEALGGAAEGGDAAPQVAALVKTLAEEAARISEGVLAMPTVNMGYPGAFGRGEEGCAPPPLLANPPPSPIFQTYCCRARPH